MTSLRLQGGHRDIPIVLLPLINELRAARGAAALGQEALPRLLEAPTEAELEHARGSLAGRNRALLDTVSTAIKEDLLKVKDALDLHLRGSRDNVQDLQAQTEALDRIGDTLGMLGLDSARAVVQEQRRIVHDIASGARPPAETICWKWPARCCTSTIRSTTRWPSWAAPASRATPAACSRRSRARSWAR